MAVRRGHGFRGVLNPAYSEQATFSTRFGRTVLGTLAIFGVLLTTVLPASASSTHAYDAPVHLYDIAANSVQMHTREATPVTMQDVAESLQGTVATPVTPISVLMQSFVATNTAVLPQSISQTFKGGTYTTTTLQQELTLFRYSGGGSQPIGQFWTQTAYSIPGRAQQYLAPPPGNTATTVTTIRVPVGTTIYEGQAASAFGRAGGGNQVYIPQVDPAWVVP